MCDAGISVLDCEGVTFVKLSEDLVVQAKRHVQIQHRSVSKLFGQAGRRERASNSSAFLCQFNSNAGIEPAFVRMVVQTEGSAAVSVSRRIVRAQRCSIKALTCSTTAFPAKTCSGADWSLRAVAGSDFANSRMRRLA